MIKKFMQMWLDSIFTRRKERMEQQMRDAKEAARIDAVFEEAAGERAEVGV